MTVSHVFEKSAMLAKRGTKQTCGNLECGSKFYDLRRAPSACPYCGTSSDAPGKVVLDFDMMDKPHSRKFRWVEPQKPAVEVAKVEEEADKDAEIPSAAEELLIDEDEDPEAVAEGTNEIA